MATTWYQLDQQVEQLKQTIADLKSQFSQPTINQIVITSQTDISTVTVDLEGLKQDGRNVIINNNASNINYLINSKDGFVASFIKAGAGSVTFQQGAGRTLIQVDEINIMDGAEGSTATISSFGSKDYLKISNV